MNHVKFLVSVVIALAIDRIDGSADVMREMTLRVGKVIEACKTELDIPDNKMEDFVNFWKEGYELQHRETGCVVMCMSSKLNLLDPDGKLHHGNAHEFAVSHGADDGMASQLVNLVHGCENSIPNNEDACLKVLDLARCFKDGVHKLNWAPNVDLVIGEILAEV
uniref:Pheromone-binding protein 2 n=1 Tax=Carposina sasakii TaxID=252295 RepID=A0A2U9PEX3_CARSA|nr:pheromone-binding protein 2 [Carposina sasakii]